MAGIPSAQALGVPSLSVGSGGGQTITAAGIASSVAFGEATVSLQLVSDCFAGEGIAAGDAITISLVPNRTSGVAPLAVRFDATGTTGSATTEPFADLAYCWEFGDGPAGNWPTWNTLVGSPKNEDKGPVVGHVYEAPGTYEVTLNIRDRLGRVKSSTTTITVTDPDVVFAGTDTICISNDTNHTGSPSGALLVNNISTWSDGAAYAAAGKRVLFARGDTFVVDATVNLTNDGPGVIGVYGIGADPVFTIGENRTMLTGGVNNGGGSWSFLRDWRIMDLDVVGSGGLIEPAFYISGASDRITFLRVKGEYMGINFAISNGAGEPFNNVDVFWYECELDNLVGGAGSNFFFLSGEGFMLLGSRVENSTAGEHCIRSGRWFHGCIQHNYVANAGDGRHLLKLYGPDWPATGAYTEYVNISHNEWDPQTGETGWTLNIAPGNPIDERQRNILVERNVFRSGTNVGVLLRLSNIANTWVRYNLFIDTNESAVETGRQPANMIMIAAQNDYWVDAISTNVNVINNTFYRVQLHDGYTAAVQIEGSHADLSAHNNLFVRPFLDAPISYNFSAEFVESGNVTSDDVGTVFASATPVALVDFRLGASSPALAAGNGAFAGYWDMDIDPVPFGPGVSATDAGAFVSGP